MSKMHDALYYTWLSVNLLVMVLNGILNGAVLIAVYNDRSLIQRRYGILISLAVADFLKIVPLVGHIIATYFGPESNTGINACMTVSSVGLVLIGITILHLVFESINRLILIIRPLRYDILLTPRLFGISLAFVWILPITGLTMPYAVFTKSSEWYHSLRVVMFSCDVVNFNNQTLIDDNAEHASHFDIYAVIITTVYFVIPLITMAISYSIIFKVSLKHIRQLRKLEVKMKRLHHRYSERKLSTTFGSQFIASNTSSLVTVDSNANSQQSSIFPFKKRNSIAPITSERANLPKEAYGEVTESCDTRVPGISSMSGSRRSEGDVSREQSASSFGAQIDPKAKQGVELMEYTRRESNNGDDSQSRILDKARKSQDSGHGTSSQISNVMIESNNCYEIESREITRYSPMVISNETTNDKQPLCECDVSNWSAVDNISEIEVQSNGSRDDAANTTNDVKEPDDMNISATDLYNLLAGFSVMGAYAESLRAKSAAPQSSFARFQAIIKEELSNRKQEIHLVKTLGGLIIGWVLFYLPILIYSWDRLIERSFDDPGSLGLGRFLLVWALFNSALNPVIYCLRITEFKNAVKKVFRKIKLFFTSDSN